MEQLMERFLDYVRIDTQSRVQHRAGQVPSSEGQWQLARQLRDQLAAAGCCDIQLDDHCCLTATLPANTQSAAPVLGFIAHLDTSPECCHRQAHPQLVERYRGGDIALGIGERVLSPVECPVLHQLHGHSLITGDGYSPLGAEDKAGIAVIITALKRLATLPHGTLRLAFIADQHTGSGTALFDLKAFGADWAYAIDGCDSFGLGIENFYGADALVRFTGHYGHPGYSKGKLINASELAYEFHGRLPRQEKPESTTGSEGFWHLHSLKGTVAKAEIHYQIREFDHQQFLQRQQRLEQLAQQMTDRYADTVSISVSIRETCRNMREKVDAYPQAIALALAAMDQSGLRPQLTPIRDEAVGAQLSWRGLPCPSLFAGGFNARSCEEFVSLEMMEQSTRVLTAIASLALESRYHHAAA